MASAGTAPAPVSPQQPVVNPAKLIAAAHVQSSGRWFYWIAGLSLVNSLVLIFGGGLRFIVGLGITTWVDVKARQVGSIGVVLDLIINGTVAGVLLLLGSFACKSHKWAFILGMTLYGLDALVLLHYGEILSVAFHGYALFVISRGLMAVDQA